MQPHLSRSAVKRASWTCSTGDEPAEIPPADVGPGARHADRQLADTRSKRQAPFP